MADDKKKIEELQKETKTLQKSVNDGATTNKKLEAENVNLKSLLKEKQEELKMTGLEQIELKEKSKNYTKELCPNLKKWCIKDDFRPSVTLKVPYDTDLKTEEDFWTIPGTKEGKLSNQQFRRVPLENLTDEDLELLNRIGFIQHYFEQK